MTLAEKREQVLLDFINKTPGGAKRLAVLTLAACPVSFFKKLIEGLELEEEVKKLNK